MTIHDSPKFAPLCFIDLETTGLDPRNDAILEIGLVLTDGDLLPWADDFGYVPEALNLVIAPDQGFDVTAHDSFVVEMHAKSGLLAALASADAVGLKEASTRIHNWLGAAVAASGGKLLMAGSTVGQFDRQFFRREWPSFDRDFFEYRVVDVSSVKEIVKRWYGESAVYSHAKKIHRALPDIDDSIAELRHYRRTVFSPEFKNESLSSNSLLPR